MRWQSAVRLRGLAARAVAAASALLLLASCNESANEPPIQYGWFYRMVVELSYQDEPLNIEVIIACGTQIRRYPGEGRTALAMWAPYIYGMRTKDGHGVLVQSPNACGLDLAKGDTVPADFMPLVLWAPDADNLEFLIAYLHERAYEQPVSKLKFIRATITDATEDDHKAWRAGKWKDNVVPIGDVVADQKKA